MESLSIESFNGVTREFKGRVSEASRMFQERLKGDLRELKGGSNKFKRCFQRILRSVSRVFQESLKEFLCVFRGCSSIMRSVEGQGFQFTFQ